jgi:redox-sensing transcriptional repressor
MIRAKISAAPSIQRLPSYLSLIRQLENEEGGYISGTAIARALNLEPIQVRKDLALTGIAGKPKKGYRTAELICAIEHFLEWDSPKDAVLIGAGSLGTALMGYAEFSRHGLNIVAAFDNNPRTIGAVIHGIRVLPADTMEIQIKNFGTRIAILTVPSASAQGVAEILIRAGIEGIWNFTNVKLRAPERIKVQQEDLSSGLAMLCVMLRVKTMEAALSPP